jgi:hypothetical protein
MSIFQSSVLTYTSVLLSVLVPSFLSFPFSIYVRVCLTSRTGILAFLLFTFSVSSFLHVSIFFDRLCGLAVRVLGYRSGGPGLIPSTTRKNISGSGTGSTQPREYN